MLSSIFTKMRAIIQVSEELEQDIKARLTYRAYAKKDILLKPGDISNYMYAIEKGLLISFYERNENEVVNWFLMENDITMSLLSFHRREPTTETIVAFEDCEIYLLHYEDLMELYKKYLEFNVFGRVMTEYYHCQNEERLIAMRKGRAQEKYEWLLTHYPEVIRRVPSKYIASYLGISEETLSRVRSLIR